ncbi:uncharacterized protein LOC136086844 [Hydra vulgaris]|uniref:Uncharacterized protein LOC136086844 n=1 Tax=Hydra vulgaris TaxID=6087 RepID=A0ABM4CU12_HYDVU
MTNIENMLLEKEKNNILEKTKKKLKEQEKYFAVITDANVKIITGRLDKLDWEDSEKKVLKLFEEVLGVKGIKIERTHRTGPRDIKKNRAIVLKLLNYIDKVEIIKNSGKLKGKNIFINEDFCGETIKIRKELKEKMLNERALGKYAVITFDKLILREWKPKKSDEGN